MQTIVEAILSLFHGNISVLAKEVIVFCISVLPILELRGGLLAASILGLDPIPSYILCMLGNILPIPFILWLVDKVFQLLKKTFLKNFILWLEKKAMDKKEKIEKYGYLGLILFVGIPLPGTGAWTGCLIAVLLGMDKKKSFLSALIGVFIASIIMMLISFGLLKIWI